MPEERPEPAHDGAPEMARARSRWARRGVVAAAVVVVLAIGFVAVTGVTGLDAPGWMHRYPYDELGALAQRINDDAGALRTPDDCWRMVRSTDDAKRDPDGPLRDIARVDHLRSRVVVRVYASASGRVDRPTRRIVQERLQRLIDAEPRFDWGMVKLEPSPDGWLPVMSCPLLTRGWIFGF